MAIILTHDEGVWFPLYDDNWAVADATVCARSLEWHKVILWCSRLEIVYMYDLISKV